MKIYKVADSCPPGMVDIEFTFNDDGSATRKIIAHGPDVGCKKANHSKLMNDVSNTRVNGFNGPLFEVEDEGLTQQGVAELSQPVAPTKAAPFSGVPKIKAPEQKRKLAVPGFDV